MSLYALMIIIVVLGLFVMLSLLPVLFTGQELDSLVLLPQ
jgi:hypothetical protein